MENVADALKIGAAILIFAIAIASSFSLFGTAKQTADSIISMRDKQAYLDASELDTLLYTSSEAISQNRVANITTKGDRIVGINDVISTIYRYSKEKYGVTIIERKADGTGKVKARFDSNTEDIMRQYNNIQSGLEEYKKELKDNTTTVYATPSFTNLEDLYKIKINGINTYGAPWYGNDTEIQNRINCDISGEKYTYNGQTYQGKNLLNLLEGKKIIEVTNEIDQSKYVEDGGNTTNLLQQYKMPTVEIVYIIYN